MRSKVLLHLAVLFISIAAVRIIAERAAVEDAIGGVFSRHNIPLAAAVFVIIVLLESTGRRLPVSISWAAAAASLIFLLTSAYLPPKGHSHDFIFVFSYLSFLLTLSISIASSISKSPGPGSVIRVMLVLGVAGFLAGFLYTFSGAHRYHSGEDADAAVVLGGAVWGPHTPSPDLRARLDAAANLYERGDASKIVVTGGTRRFNTFESKIGAEYLREIGIPDTAIITEEKTLNTFEQIVYVRRHLMGVLKMKNVIIVSDGWHLPRALLMCGWLDVEASGYSSRYRMSAVATAYWRIREAAGLQVYTLFGA